MKKKALFFIDEGVVKIVFGNFVKIVRAEDGDNPQTQEFLKKLFTDYAVLFVQELSEASKEDFDEFLARAKQRGVIPTPKGQGEQATAPVPRAQVAPAPRAPKSSLPPVSPPDEPEPETMTSDLTWVKTRNGTCIIVDDLFTDADVRGMTGIKQALSVPAGRAINLAMLNPESLKKSIILRKLLSSGTLVLVDAAEAARMQADYDRKATEEESARMDIQSPLVDRNSDEVVDRTTVVGAPVVKSTKRAPRVEGYEAETVEATAGAIPTESDLVSEDPGMKSIFNSLRPMPAENAEEGEVAESPLPPPVPKLNLGDPDRPKGSIRRR